MSLAGIREGDIVRVQRKSEPVFYAHVSEIGPTDYVRKGEAQVMMLMRGGSEPSRPRIVKAREITGHWRQRRTRA